MARLESPEPALAQTLVGALMPALLRTLGREALAFAGRTLGLPLARSERRKALDAQSLDANLGVDWFRSSRPPDFNSPAA